jgi:Flp pilus assembly secretin CpaC
MRRAPFLSLTLSLASLYLAISPAYATDPVSVVMDRAKVMRLSAPAESVIVGNPGIADVTIHDRSTLVLTGKMVGTTNLVVMDSKGNVIAEAVISVGKPQESLVTVQRGSMRNSYFCTPDCNPTVEVGDANDHFGQTNSQIQIRTALGQQATASPQQ